MQGLHVAPLVPGAGEIANPEAGKVGRRILERPDKAPGAVGQAGDLEAVDVEGVRLLAADLVRDALDPVALGAEHADRADPAM